jgi:DNA repair exonuclease SbcCD ATPase subunit
VQKLHLVGFTTDHDGLIFSARRGARSGSFVVPLDAALLEALEEASRLRPEEEADTALPPVRANRQESALSVKEVQARLRAGRTVEDVASEAGVDLEWVERFAAPVIAEQAQIIASLRATVMTKPRLGASLEPLGLAVYRNLATKGVHLTEEELDEGWTTYQLYDSRWIVEYRYELRGKRQVVSWEFDHATGEIVPTDRSSGMVAYVQPGEGAPKTAPARRVSAARAAAIKPVIPKPARVSKTVLAKKIAASKKAAAERQAEVERKAAIAFKKAEAARKAEEARKAAEAKQQAAAEREALRQAAIERAAADRAEAARRAAEEKQLAADRKRAEAAARKKAREDLRKAEERRAAAAKKRAAAAAAKKRAAKQAAAKRAAARPARSKTAPRKAAPKKAVARSVPAPRTPAKRAAKRAAPAAIRSVAPRTTAVRRSAPVRATGGDGAARSRRTPLRAMPERDPRDLSDLTELVDSAVPRGDIVRPVFRADRAAAASGSNGEQQHTPAHLAPRRRLRPLRAP